MKNTFYFTVKALLLSRCSNVSLDFLVMQKTDENEMKFAQLKRYDIRNIFLKNLTKNLVEKLFPDPFLKNQNCAYTWINSLKFCTVLFHCMPSWGLIKDKKDLELVSLPQFLHNFWKKKLSCLFYELTKFHRLVAFTLWDIWPYVYCNCLLTRLWRNKFWNQYFLSYQAVIFCMSKKAKTEI